MRAQIRSLLKQYRRSIFYSDKEHGTYQEFLRFIGNRIDCMRRSCLSGHITGSAWILNHDFSRVLLTHHRKLNIWVQLGGHADGDYNIQRVAMREAKEESGLEQISFIHWGLFDIDIHRIPASRKERAHLHFDLRFAMQSTNQNVVASAESHEVAFVKLDEIRNFTTEGSILRMVSKCRLLG